MEQEKCLESETLWTLYLSSQMPVEQRPWFVLQVLCPMTALLLVLSFSMPFHSFKPVIFPVNEATQTPRITQGQSNVALNISRDGASTTSVGNLCQGLTTSTVKNAMHMLWIRNQTLQFMLSGKQESPLASIPQPEILTGTCSTRAKLTNPASCRISYAWKQAHTTNQGILQNTQFFNYSIFFPHLQQCSY